MKLLGFTIVSLFLTLPYSRSLSSGVVEITNKEIIDNSVVRISVSSPHTRGSKGSGVLIILNQEVKVLTNAHVCLGHEIYYLKNKKTEEVEFNYGIHTKNETAFFSASFQELKYELKEDWCLIPYPYRIKYPIMNESFLSDQVEARAFSLTYNHHNSSNKPLSLFKACVVENETENCNESSKPQGSIKLTLGSKKILARLRLKEHYKFSFPTIPGDSGSPFFNSQGKLVGLVAGRTIDQTQGKTKWSITTHIPTFMKIYKQ